MSMDGTERGEGALRPYSPKQVAKLLGCNLKSVYGGIERGEIPSVKIGRRLFIPGPAFEKLLRDGAKA
jgi:excisionase family DNA binding protein